MGGATVSMAVTSTLPPCPNKYHEKSVMYIVPPASPVPASNWICEMFDWLQLSIMTAFCYQSLKKRVSYHQMTVQENVKEDTLVKQLRHGI